MKKDATKNKIKTKTAPKPLLVVGWREWVGLPGLGIKIIKAKIDTGARTSAIHAFAIKPFKENGRHRIRFYIHPYQRRAEPSVMCVADVKDIRWVTDSGGHRERRYVIDTPLLMGGQMWPIEITLTNRDTMNFRMLLGRTAMLNRLLVNPVASFLLNKKIDTSKT